MNTIYITKALKVFNLSGEGKAFPASDKAVQHLQSEKAEQDLLVVTKNNIETIVHFKEAEEEKLYIPSANINYFHEDFIAEITHNLRTTTVREDSLKAIESSGSIRVEQFFHRNKKYLKFMNPSDLEELKVLSLSSADKALEQIKVNC